MDPTPRRPSQPGIAPYPKGLATSQKFQQLTCKIQIPTPFELFRLYDGDQSGCVTHSEFIMMLRDLEALPEHYAPEDDAEFLLQRAARKKSKVEEALARRQEVLAALRGQPSSRDSDVAEVEAQVQGLQATLVELGAEHAKWKKAADAEPVEPGMRKHRKEWREWAEKEFQRADLASNNMLSIDEFYIYYYGKLCFRFPVLRTGTNPGASLFNIYVKYCSFGRHERSEEMLGHQWAKLAKDAGLTNGRTVTKATIDIIYHRARAADESLETYQPRAGVAATARMHYPQFLFALNKVADKRKSGFQEVVARILSSVSSLPAASMADFVLVAGDSLEPGDPIPEYLQRHPLLPTDKPERATDLPDAEIIAKMKKEAEDALMLSLGLMPKDMGKGGNLDGIKAEGRKNKAKQSATGLPEDGSFVPPAAAKAGDPPLQATQTPNVSAGGAPPPPKAPGSVRLTDDYSSDYDDDGDGGGGGGHAGHGGSGHTHHPHHAHHTHQPKGGAGAATGIYALLPALDHARAHEFVRSKAWEKPEPAELQATRQSLTASGMGFSRGLDDPQLMSQVRGLDPDTLMMALKRVFEAYNKAGSGMDSSAMDKVRFHRVLRDAKLVSESGPLPARKVDDIFKRVLPHSSRALNFIQFIEALRHVTVATRACLNETMERLVAVAGPEPLPAGAPADGQPPPQYRRP